MIHASINDEITGNTCISDGTTDKASNNDEITGNTCISDVTTHKASINDEITGNTCINDEPRIKHLSMMRLQI